MKQYQWRTQDLFSKEGEIRGKYYTFPYKYIKLASHVHLISKHALLNVLYFDCY